MYPGGFVQVENTGFCSASGRIGYMYEQEIVRDRAMPSYQRYKTMVRRHVDQMVSTRNCKARNERIETGVLVSGLKGRKVSVERNVGGCFQWRAIGQVSKRRLLQFQPRKRSWTKHNRPLLLQRRRHRLTEENPRKVLAPEEKVFLERKVKKRAKICPPKELVRIRRVIIGMVQTAVSAKSATNV